VAVIDAQSVSKRFLLRHNASVELKVRFLGLIHPERRQSIEEFWALRGVSLHINHGEALGLVGRNGSGKSTFLKLIAAIHRPTNGRLLVARGARISSMIELGVGFHPELTGRENVVLNAAIHGLTRAEIDRIYDAVVDYSGLEHFIDVPIKNYSSGMHMRLGFAISANLDPDILLLDEIFAVGDADFQQRCVATVKRFMDEGKTIIFVSHAPSAIRAICRRVCVLEQGELTFDGDVEGGLAFYERLLARRAAQDESGRTTVAKSAIGDVDEEELDRAPHRAVPGGHWREAGRWQFEFLRAQGLQPQDFVLDVGCGSLATAVHLIPFVEPGHFVGADRNSSLLDAGMRIELPRAGIAPARAHFLLLNDTFDLGLIPYTFDFALADSLFAYLPFNSVARCLAEVVRKLKPSGRFYATWFENPDPANFDPIIQQPCGISTYQDREPYHYPFGLIAAVCEAVGAGVERVSVSGHPRGESVLVISPRQK
jgi:ABC-type polysaccharide/polyol phosphate transport system ATPase subunit/SAM-dependent methyltransferase